MPYERTEDGTYINSEKVSEVKYLQGKSGLNYLEVIMVSGNSYSLSVNEGETEEMAIARMNRGFT